MLRGLSKTQKRVMRFEEELIYPFSEDGGNCPASCACRGGDGDNNHEWRKWRQTEIEAGDLEKRTVMNECATKEAVFSRSREETEKGRSRKCVGGSKSILNGRRRIREQARGRFVCVRVCVAPSFRSSHQHPVFQASLSVFCGLELIEGIGRDPSGPGVNMDTGRDICVLAGVQAWHHRQA
jgi:hypothetical protein